LLVVPVLYAMLDDLKTAIRRTLHKSKLKS